MFFLTGLRHATPAVVKFVVADVIKQPNYNRTIDTACPTLRSENAENSRLWITLYLGHAILSVNTSIWPRITIIVELILISMLNEHNKYIRWSKRVGYV